ncbi:MULTISPECIES: maleylpyruvate isomerase family mycothiol-dependent enzyme [unclassified Mycobacterium]|uniref:maleylpyruvate isomerase family mycothiol-dependent enzyme n=1 Tax=unclassified Mycobacterium TaxID=2642494 RepID=UPI0007FD2854|nr:MULTISPECIES: maleylpyruvate isomerase family mycothiol-dependent enzyme [unclassified Mycobacterium]OBH07059.1 translation initiation factor 2 [Mycobacterium sp. E2699]OBI56780.1 translation initiation factor 2 [Mycobacterium sp. E787]
MSTPPIQRPGPVRERTVSGLLDEYRSFAEILGALDVLDWTRATRCNGWQVRDIAGHLVGQAVDTVSGAIGTRTPDDQAAALRGEAPGSLAARLHAASEAVARLATVFDDAVWASPSPVPGLTVGQGVHALLNDAYVHGDDVRAALGLPSDTGPGLYASLDFVLGALLRDAAAAAEPAIARLLDLSAEDFTRQTGIAAHDFLLVATGRGDAALLRLPESVNIFR